jgi:hypothetical protein
MRFIVTCLDDDFKTRVLASKSKIFNSVQEAVTYGASVAVERVASVVPVPTDAQHAAEFIFDHIVEKTPDIVTGDPEDIKHELRYELCNEEIMAVFTPDNEIVSAFVKEDFLDFISEIERLVLEV